MTTYLLQVKGGFERHLVPDTNTENNKGSISWNYSGDYQSLPLHFLLLHKATAKPQNPAHLREWNFDGFNALVQ